MVKVNSQTKRSSTEPHAIIKYTETVRIPLKYILQNYEDDNRGPKNEYPSFELNKDEDVVTLIESFGESVQEFLGDGDYLFTENWEADVSLEKNE